MPLWVYRIYYNGTKQTLIVEKFVFMRKRLILYTNLKMNFENKLQKADQKVYPLKTKASLYTNDIASIVCF